MQLVKRNAGDEVTGENFSELFLNLTAIDGRDEIFSFPRKFWTCGHVFLLYHDKKD